mmetsp:Transcript_20063/g.55500  ORF Transcript_20063/g.55500 Transcript_20063/m.55500 type:complete len:209 (-) Transcript_20063:323-949(-)
MPMPLWQTIYRPHTYSRGFSKRQVRRANKRQDDPRITNQCCRRCRRLWHLEAQPWEASRRLLARIAKSRAAQSRTCSLAAQGVRQRAIKGRRWRGNSGTVAMAAHPLSKGYASAKEGTPSVPTDWMQAALAHFAAYSSDPNFLAKLAAGWTPGCPLFARMLRRGHPKSAAASVPEACVANRRQHCHAAMVLPLLAGASLHCRSRQRLR